MKRMTLVLALLMGGTQLLVAADCCCAIVCKHHSEICSKCTHEGAPNGVPRAEAGKDCCGKHGDAAPAPAPKRCSHIEPSSEVTTQAVDPVAAPPTLILDLPAAAIAPRALSPSSPEAVSPIRGSPPLNLLHSVFLI